ncbi:IclR family transcriptional regulator [Advenella incenata]|jgi:DNA-binding IclR family transcriptional regulator
MDANQSSENGVAAVDRAIAILQAMSTQATPMALADLARSTGLYKSTLLRLIASLEKASLVARRADGSYVLGPYAYQLGRAYEATHHLVEVLRPILAELVVQDTESASFHVYDSSSTRLCLLRIDSHHSTLDRIDVGDLLPLDRGAAGKLITRFRSTGLAPKLSNVTAVSLGERDSNCAAVAVAVFGPGNQIVGAISLSGPKERFTNKAISKMTKQALVAAAQATQLLGGHWPGS